MQSSSRPGYARLSGQCTCAAAGCVLLAQLQLGPGRSRDRDFRRHQLVPRPVQKKASGSCSTNCSRLENFSVASQHPLRIRQGESSFFGLQDCPERRTKPKSGLLRDRRSRISLGQAFVSLG